MVDARVTKGVEYTLHPNVKEPKAASCTSASLVCGAIELGLFRQGLTLCKSSISFICSTHSRSKGITSNVFRNLVDSGWLPPVILRCMLKSFLACAIICQFLFPRLAPWRSLFKLYSMQYRAVQNGEWRSPCTDGLEDILQHLITDRCT